MANVPETPNEAELLTPGAAFVVHLAVRSDDAATTAVPECGRVEHVLSGATMHFDSITDLVTFMAEAVSHSRRSENAPSGAGSATLSAAHATTDSN